MSTQSQEVSLPAPEANAIPVQAHRGKYVWQQISGNRKASTGLIIVGFFILLAIFGPIILPQDPHAFSTAVLEPPSTAHWFGTTSFGEDVFVQTVVGARFSVFMGLGIGLVTLIISVVVGLTSACANATGAATSAARTTSAKRIYLPSSREKKPLGFSGSSSAAGAGGGTGSGRGFKLRID